jgi:hypothetical protein
VFPRHAVYPNRAQEYSILTTLYRPPGNGRVTGAI